uniref:Uncharacterized protein n=1 Tax=Glossina palpalis gambiensis TaxID=67801 RepID=A0A1B0AZG6_9MUSC
MHFKQILFIKFLFNVILLKGLIKSCNGDIIGALQDCNTGGETRICVPQSLCKRDRFFALTYDEKCRNDPNGPIVVCCLMSNLLVGVVENGSARNTTEKTLPERMCDVYHIYRHNETIRNMTSGEGSTGRFPFLVSGNSNEEFIVVSTTKTVQMYIRHIFANTNEEKLSLQSAHKRCPSVARAVGVIRYNQRLHNVDVIDCVIHPLYQFSIYTHYILLVKLAKHMECATASEYPKDSCPV